MKTLNQYLAMAGITLLVASASAQNPAYSSKAGLLKQTAVPAVPVAVSEVTQISSKPWLYANRVAEKVSPAVANVELKNLTAVNYNSKKAVRGEGPVEFEVAPLK